MQDTTKEKDSESIETDPETEEKETDLSACAEAEKDPDTLREGKRKNRRKLLLFLIITLSVLTVFSLAALYLRFFTSPVLELVGESEVTVSYSDEYHDAGAAAKYLFFDFSDRIVTENDVDVTKTGDYIVRFSLSFRGKTYVCERKVFVKDLDAPVITLSGSTDGTTLSSLDFFVEEGFCAADNADGDLTDKVTVTKEVNGEIGRIIYTVADSSGNLATAERILTVKDIISPVITLNEEAKLNITTPSFNDPGAFAKDDLDGDITSKITVTTDYEAGKTGEFSFDYRVIDNAGNEAHIERKITVSDITAPYITLNGSDVVYVCAGDPYADEGAYASDDFDGTLNVTVSGSVDTATVGTYSLTYSSSDKSGNSSSRSRKIVVMAKPAPVSGGITGGGYVSDSTIYLTFDDGPSSVTHRVLDILAKNDVKATFFILNYSESNKAIVSRIINEGHTLAIHGYSHDYAAIYSSPDAFLSNVTSLHDKIVSDFGYSTNIMRFPGGSSNTVSRKYCTGIMTTLCPLMQNLGYTYFDWNVSSGDAAGGTVSSYAISSNVTSSLRHGRNNVVLMHDTSAKSTTADALQTIIDYARANGYTFAGLSSNTPPVHHGINN